MSSKLEFTTESPDSPGSNCVLDLTCTTSVDPEAPMPVKAVGKERTRGPRRSKKRAREENEDEESEAKRLLANTQERVRMQKMNQALEELKKVLPPHFHAFHKKMSKIRTLRLAMNYIAMLSDLIQRDNARREAAYRQTLRYIHEQGCIPQFSPDGALVSSIHPYVPDQEFMTPVYSTPSIATPYHSYIGSLHGITNSNAFETPVQHPLRHQPRHLDFYSMPTQDQPSATETLRAGTRETPKKVRKDTIVHINSESNEKVSPAIPVLRKYQKAETFASPFLGSRNQNELDLSFLSTGSDGNREEGESGARVTTLEDIIDEDDNDDDVREVNCSYIRM